MDAPFLYMGQTLPLVTLQDITCASPVLLNGAAQSFAKLVLPMVKHVLPTRPLLAKRGILDSQSAEAVWYLMGVVDNS